MDLNKEVNMASKFFNKPQLGQAQLSNAAQTNLPSSDRLAEIKAQKAAQSIESLNQMGQRGVQQISGQYLQNIQAKNRLESGKQRPDFINYVNSQISQTENFESLGSQGLQDKYREYSESFLEQHKDKPYQTQLRSDLEQMSERMLGNMLKQRDAMHTQIVSDSTAEGASNAAQMYAEGLINSEQLKGRLNELSFDSTLAFQVPSSSEIDLNDDSRGKYQGLTQAQSKEAILRGIMIQTGKPANSKIAELLNSEEFRNEMGIPKVDEEYDKLVKVAFDKGARADKVVYENGLDGLKERLYAKTNQGFNVNIDTELQLHFDQGKQLTAQDEAKLRKTFKGVNDINTTSVQYVQGLLQGKDLSAGLSGDKKQAIYERAFTNTLGLNDVHLTVDNVSTQLSTREGQVGFSDYLKSGGKIPKKFKQMFDVPAGAGADKWNRASAAIVAMQAGAVGSGQSVEEIIGVKQVSKIRGMAKILNNPDMEASVKQNAIEALQTQSTSFNSKGYLKGTGDQPIDNEWLNDVSKDAPWTTDDYVSDQQNAAEIAGNYHAYRMAGNSEEEAQELAIDLFNKSNRQLEMSNGSEIAVPVQHKNLNNISIDEFSKSMVRDSFGNLVPRFPSIQEQRADLEVSTGKGYISEWRARTNISFQKSYNYGKTGKYDMLYDGRLVDNASFSYEELEQFIADSPAKLREKMTKGKHRSFKEVEEDALTNRRKAIRNKRSNVDVSEQMRNLYDLKI